MRDDWAESSFEEITESLKRGPFGGDLKKAFFVETGYRVYEQQHAIRNDFSLGRYFIDEERFQKLKACNVGPDDYIVSCSGTLGKIARLPKNAPVGIINQALLRIRINESIINSRYFLEFFRSSLFQKKILKDSRGSGMQNMAGIKEIKPILISLPPLPEQRAIVAKIEGLFSDLDQGIADLKTAQAQLKIYRQAVLKKAFEGDVFWNEQTLKETIKISSGNGLTKANRDDSGKFLVYGGNGKTGHHSEYMFDEPKLIIGRVGVHCGNVHVADPQSWVTDNAFVVQFDEKKYELKFLLYLLKSLRLNQYSSSTAQPVISGGKIYPVKFLCPPEREQHQIVREIETRLSVCDEVEDTLFQSLSTAEALRQSILKKAFEGNLLTEAELAACRAEPDWEPAAALLARIKDEKKG